MNAHRPTAQATLELELDAEGRGPAGALMTTDGRRRAFEGWIELASAIEDWRETQERADTDHPPKRSATT